jgi:acyl-CoA thioester hydrolase
MKQVNEVEIDVRFNEVDEMGIVHNSVYLIWFEIARYSFAAAALGITYSKMSDSKLLVPVIHSECKYLNAVSFPDRVRIKTFFEPTPKAVLMLHYLAFSDRSCKKVAYGKTVNAFTSAQGRLLLQFPAALQDKFENTNINLTPYTWQPRFRNLSYREVFADGK